MRATLSRHLLAWTLGALALVWASFIVFGWQTGQHEADELTDGHLASVSALLLAYSHGEFGAREAPPRPPGAELKAHDYQQSLSVVMWDSQGTVLTRTGNAPLPRFDAASEGFGTLALGEPATDWRTFSRWNADRSRKVMVLLSVHERDALADDIAGQIVEPGLWLLPAVALVLGLAVMRGLRPLLRMTQDVHAMDIHRAQPLAAPHHEELAAVVDAINRLAGRYHAALTRERELANEFAHELRTPIAGLALQARALREAPPGPERDAMAARVEQQALRAGEVLAHLLALARASRAEMDEAAQEVDLAGIARAVVARFAPAAHAGGRELSLEAPQPLRVTGHPLLLELALRNLVENALSHTAPGSQVEVRVDAAARRVDVCDWLPEGAAPPVSAAGGPALGLGLGHRVVEKIAAIHQARFERPAPGARPHCYRLVF
jgi:two-component system sensor histidine kinase QseC